MNALEYRDFYDRVGKRIGWDFSKMKCVSEGLPWDFYNEVTKVCKKSDLLLDIGTGGGEAILSIADSALLLVGIDHSTGMMETATKNAANSGIPNVRFLQIDAEHLDFPKHFFQVVSSRHSCFYPNEIANVLAPGGIFLTQQVSENDKENIKEAFGRGQAFGKKNGTLKTQYITELEEAGFTNIEAFEGNVTEYYQTPEDLLFLLKHTPIVPNFGETEDDFQILEQLIRDNQTDQGIMTNSSRFMIIARK